MIEVRRLRLLVELSRRGTIAAVAQARHMSPSGVSHQLGLLEREVGAELLQRVGRGVRLTEAGRRLALRGSEILVALEAARTEARSPEDQPSGTIRVAAFGSAVRALLPAVLACQDAHPGLRIELAESEPEVAVPALLSGSFDVVVSEEYPGAVVPSRREIHRRILLRDPLEVVVPTALLAGRDLAHAGADLPWALEPEGAASREWAVQHCRGLGFTPAVQYESWDLELLLLLVRRGAAASVLPRMVLPAPRADEEPRRPGAPRPLRRVDTGRARTIVTLVRRGREADPTVRTVRDELHTAFDSADDTVSEGTEAEPNRQPE